MLARNSAPGIGAQASPYLQPGQIAATVSYRYQFSHRHFVGDQEQVARTLAGSEVQNGIHLFDLELTYALTHRLQLAVGVPYLIAERSVPFPDAMGNVAGRYQTSAHGLGDVSLAGRLWLLDPLRFLRGNIALGLGLKIPTGDPGKLDLDPSQPSRASPVDQSIQLGDGGWGAAVDLQAFLQAWRFTFYLSGLYLFNPRDTNGVATGRTEPGEEVMSVGDSYLAGAGAFFAIPKIPAAHRLALKLGARVEGVPKRDALGGSDGFRRPGIAVSIDPGLSYAYQEWAFAVSVPVAVYRNRQASVAEEMAGRHGDAAFADYLILASVTRLFGTSKKEPACASP